jgi:DNA-binding MarR family transcriptional regulator
VVTLALTASGRRIVRKVAAARQEDLARIAGQLSAGDRERLTAALRQLVAVVGEGYGTLGGGPIPM